MGNELLQEFTLELPDDGSSFLAHELLCGFFILVKDLLIAASLVLLDELFKFGVLFLFLLPVVF
jgi:hypothetical protein